MRAQTYPTAVSTIHSHAILPMPSGVVTHRFYLTFNNFVVGKGVLCRRTCGALPDLKETPNLQMWYFRPNFRIRKYLPLTLILSHSPCCCYLCLHAVKTPTWKQAFWGRHDRVAHIGYGGIHCHLAARLRRRRVPQWRDGKLGLHLSSLRNTNFMPPPPLSSPHTSILLIYII